MSEKKDAIERWIGWTDVSGMDPKTLADEYNENIDYLYADPEDFDEYINERIDLKQWAMGHNTSIEIASAISEMAGEDEEKMQSIWGDPSPDEMARVISMAWEMTDDGIETLNWGCEVIRRT